jgi:ubiquinone/menaquinone biosynthesis C-methylase UbiE
MRPHVRVDSDDYHRAFSGQGRRSLHRLLNVLSRRRTFETRMQVVRTLLQKHGVAAKRVLDLGCGSGEVSLLAAELGANVTGLDVVEQMVAIARESARRASLAEAVHFQVADVLHTPLEPTDVTLLVSVLEYYSAIDELLTRVCNATGELLVLADTRGPRGGRPDTRPARAARPPRLPLHLLRARRGGLSLSRSRA